MTLCGTLSYMYGSGASFVFLLIDQSLFVVVILDDVTIVSIYDVNPVIEHETCKMWCLLVCYFLIFICFVFLY